MKQTLFCLAATSLFAIGSFAQTSGSSATSSGTQTTTTDSQTTGKKAHSTKPTSLTGCVQAGDEANEYILQTASKKKIELESTDDLKPHVGHTVKVQGTWDHSGAGEKHDMAAMGGAPSSADKNEMNEHKTGQAHHFKVSKIDMVSDTCTVKSSQSSKSGKTP